MKPPAGYWLANGRLLKELQGAARQMRLIGELQNQTAGEIANIVPPTTAHARLTKTLSDLATHQTAFYRQIHNISREIAASTKAFNRIEASYRRTVEDILRLTVAPGPLMEFAISNSGTAAIAAMSDARAINSALSPLWEYIPEGTGERSDAEIAEDLEGFRKYIRELLSRIPCPTFWEAIGLVVAFYALYISGIDAGNIQRKIEAVQTIEQAQQDVLKDVRERLEDLNGESKRSAAENLVSTAQLKVRRTWKTNSEIVGNLYIGTSVQLKVE